MHVEKLLTSDFIVLIISVSWGLNYILAKLFIE